MLDRITFAVTHYKRPRDLDQCLRSIRDRYPGANVISQNTGGNLAVGRNRLVERTDTEFYFMLEEDMRLLDETDVESQVRILDHDSEIAGVGNSLIEPSKTWLLASDFHRVGRTIYVEPSRSMIRSTPAGDFYRPCDLLANCGLFRTSVLRKFQWDERLKLMEHYEFFLRVTESRLWRFAAGEGFVEHKQSRPSDEYRIERTDTSKWIRLERKIAGGRYRRDHHKGNPWRSRFRFVSIVLSPGGNVDGLPAPLVRLTRRMERRVTDQIENFDFKFSTRIMKSIEFDRFCLYSDRFFDLSRLWATALGLQDFEPVLIVVNESEKAWRRRQRGRVGKRKLSNFRRRSEAAQRALSRWPWQSVLIGGEQ
jgi:hypothetical protein